MKVTDVRVRKVDHDNRTKAYVTITLDECFVVRDIRVVEGQNGFFVAMPSRKRPDGQFKDISHPINTETRKMIEEAIFSEYDRDEEEKTEEQEPEKEVETETETETETEIEIETEIE